MTLFHKINELSQQHQTAVMATVIEATGSAPRQAGSRMLILADGSPIDTIGGGAVEKQVIDEALALLAAGGGTRLMRFDLGRDLSMACGGTMTLFLEVLQPIRPLLIFGAGHIGLALAALGKLLGYQVTVIDNRPEFANKERFPAAERIIAKSYDEALAELTFTDNTTIVIVTHRHLHDKEILQHCLNQPFAYLGMIGSRSKVKPILADLRENGISAELLNRVHTPIGLDIGAQTPAEIAVAIAAEWIACRYGTSQINHMSLTGVDTLA
jgi:xanthine dehydrogenase accessory factor